MKIKYNINFNTFDNFNKIQYNWKYAAGEYSDQWTVEFKY